MNLWVKRAGKLFIAVLFLMSCEDDSFLLGFKNQNPKFNLRYHEISLESSVILMDSAITDNMGSPTRYLVGRYFDNVFGEVRSEAYAEFYPVGDSIYRESSAILDSLIIQFRLDSYVYGSGDESTEDFSLHELQEALDTAVLRLNKRYYYNSSAVYDPTPLVTTSQEIDYDDAVAAASDTLLLTFKLAKTHPFAIDIFNFIKDHPFQDDSTFYTEFNKRFKGLAVVPSSSNTKVFGFSPSYNALTRFAMHYHNSVDTLVHMLNFGTLSFNKITTDRSTSELSGIPTYQEFTSATSGYVQSGSPVVTKFDLSDFYAFADTIPQMTINSAELVITPQGVADGLGPPAVVVQIHKENNQFMNYFVKEDFDRLTGYLRLDLNGKYFAAGSDLNVSTRVAPATLTYNKTENKFSGFITLFMQDLFDNKNKENKIMYLSINPYDPNIGKSVNRLVFDKNSVKLRINYTKPVSSNL